MTQREEFGRLLRYVKPYKMRLVAGIVCLSVVGLAEGLIALMIAPIFDRVLNPGAPDNRLLLIRNPFTHEAIYLNSFLPHQTHSVGTLFAIAILAVFVGRGIAEYLGNTLVQYAGIAGVTDLRNQVYAKVVRQPIAFFQNHPTGRVLSTIINDVERVRCTFSDSLAASFRHIFTLLFLVVVLLATNWKMTLGSVVLLPMVVWPVRTLGKRIRRSSESIQSGVGTLSQIVQETVSGNRVVKAFGMEDFEIGKFRESSRRLLRENMRWIRAYVATSPLMDLLGPVVIVPVLMYARVQIKLGLMTTGIFGTFVYALFKSYEPVKGLGTVYQQFEQAFGVSTKVFEYLGIAEEPAEEPGVRVLPPFTRLGVAHGERRSSNRHCGVQRRGQDHTGESPAAIVPGELRRCAAGRSRCARGNAAFPARADGHRHARNDPVQRYGLEQHLLWAAGTSERTRGSRGQGGAGT